MLLIDGNNLWYAAMQRGEPLAGISRSDLIRVLEGYAAGSSEPVTVVLDGYGPAGQVHGEQRGNLTLLYAGARIADELIGRQVDDSTAPHGVSLVTADREIIRHARKRRVRVIESDAFAARLEKWLNRPTRRRQQAEPAAKQTGLGGVGKSINDWLQYLDHPPGTSDIIKDERAGSSQPQFPCKSVPSPSPEVGAVPEVPGDMGRVFQDVQPLKRRERRRRAGGPARRDQ